MDNLSQDISKKRIAVVCMITAGIVIAVFLGLIFGFFELPQYLKENYELTLGRRGVFAACFVGVVMFRVVVFLLKVIGQFFRKYFLGNSKEGNPRGNTVAISIEIVLAAVILFGIGAFIPYETSVGEGIVYREQIIEKDGEKAYMCIAKMRVAEKENPDRKRIYFEYKHGIFLKKLDKEPELEENLSEESSETYEEDQSNGSDTKDDILDENYSVSDEESKMWERIEKNYNELYEQLLKDKYPQNEIGYSAKGDFYSIVEEGMTEENGEKYHYEIEVRHDIYKSDEKKDIFVMHKRLYSRPHREHQGERWHEESVSIVKTYEVDSQTGNIQVR